MNLSHFGIRCGMWISGSVLVTLAVWWFVISPQQIQIAADITRIGEMSTAFNQTDNRTKQYIAGVGQLNILEQDIAAIRSSYVSPTTPFVLVDTIERIANQHQVTSGLHITDYVPSSIPNEAVTVPITITLSGQTTEVLNSLSDILQQPIELTPESVVLKSIAPNAVEATMQVNSYWL